MSEPPADRPEPIPAPGAPAPAPVSGSPSLSITRGFLFADLRGYTDFIERYGDAAAVELLATYRRLVREVVRTSGGAEIKTEGDSFYVVFPSASAAVQGGLAIISAAAQESADHPQRPIRVGVGIHAGESTETAEGYVGSSVNIAARVCAQAQAGEVLVTDTVRSLIRTSLPVALISRGKRPLKGIAEPIALYAVGAALPGATQTTGATAGRIDRRLGGLIALGALGLVVVLAAGAVLLRGGAGASPSPAPTSAASVPFVAAASPTATVAAGSTLAPTQTQLATARPTAIPQATPSPSPTAVVPTGTRILFSRQVVTSQDPSDPFVRGCNGQTDAKLYLLDPDHPAVASYRLTDGTDLFERSPSWSADGQLLAFIGDIQNQHSGVFVANPDGSAPRQLKSAAFIFGNPTFAVISADGARVLSDGPPEQGGWAISTSDGSTVVEAIPTGPADAQFQVVGLRWGPGDRVLSLEDAYSPDQTRLRSFNPDGSDPQILPIKWGALSPTSFALSPDGKTVAFSGYPATGPLQQLFLVPLAGGNPRVVAPSTEDQTSPTWSPDGKQLAFVQGSPTKEQLATVEVDSGRITRLPAVEGAIGCSPVWQSAPASLVGPRPAPAAGEPLPFERGVLAPGVHLLAKFQPNVELTIPDGPDGWWSDRNYVDAFTLDRIGDPSSELAAGVIQVAFTGPCRDENKTTILDGTPKGMIDWLRTRPELKFTTPVPINLGGYAGLTTDLKLKGKGCTQKGDNGTDAQFFLLGQDSMHITDQDSVRLVVIDVRGTAVTFFYGSAKDTFIGFIAAAQPILDSISFPRP